MRDMGRPLPFATAARAVFNLSLDSMVWTRRSLMMGIFVGLPLVVAIVFRAILVTRPEAHLVAPFDFYTYVIAVVWISNVLPVCALFYATSLIADEVDDRTLTYLLTRPITRPAIFAGKFAAYLATTLSLSLPPAVVTFYLLATAPRGTAVGAAAIDLVRDLGVMALTLLVYGALFALLGVLLRRPVIPGLLFLYGWELLAHLPGYLPRLTLTARLQSLIPYRPPQEGLLGLFAQVLPVGESLLALAVASVVFLGATAWIFSTREYVLEQ